MRWYLVFFALVGGALFAIRAVRRGKKDKSVEKYVCDVCHGLDCDCRRVDSEKEKN